MCTFLHTLASPSEVPAGHDPEMGRRHNRQVGLLFPLERPLVLLGGKAEDCDSVDYRERDALTVVGIPSPPGRP